MGQLYSLRDGYVPNGQAATSGGATSYNGWRCVVGDPAVTLKWTGTVAGILGALFTIIALPARCRSPLMRLAARGLRWPDRR